MFCVKSLDDGDDLGLLCTLHFSVVVSHTSVRRGQATAQGLVSVVNAAWVCVILGLGRSPVPLASFSNGAP